MLILAQVTLCFFSIVVPAWIWPVSTSFTVLVLMLDVACMLYIAAVLYALQTHESIEEDLKMLRESRYHVAAA